MVRHLKSSQVFFINENQKNKLYPSFLYLIGEIVAADDHLPKHVTIQFMGFQVQKRACMWCKFCRTFISSISLEIAGSNMAMTLFSPSKIIWRRLFLLNESVAFLNAENVAFKIESSS